MRKTVLDLGSTSVVLLIREFDKGYYFNPDEVEALLNDPRTLYSVSDFKIHEQRIEKNRYFKSISEFIENLE